MKKVLIGISIAAIVMGIVLIVGGNMLGIFIIGGSLYAIFTQRHKKTSKDKQ